MEDPVGSMLPVLEALPNAVLMIDAEGRVALANGASERLFGYACGELLGQPVEQLVPERYRSAHPGYLQAFFADLRARPMGAGPELFGLSKDGVEIPIEIGLSPVSTPSGMLTLASIVEVRPRIRAEAQFRLAVEASPSAMIMVDARRLIRLINGKAEELFGYGRGELIGQPIELLVPERARALHPGFVDDFLASPRARAMGAGRELFGRRRNGEEIPVEIGLNPLETEDGVFTLAAIIDITERKRVEFEHERLAAIVASSEDAILSKTLDGVITSWNHGAEHLFGITADEAVGKSVYSLVPERLQEQERSVLEKVRHGQAAEPFETVRCHRSGREIHVSLRLSPIRNRAGEVVGASSIARDIRELKRRDAELQRSNAELEQFAYVASHDLQEPLRMVANYTELLAQRYRGKLDEKADKYIFYASDGARRMQRLVADLLAYSRVGARPSSFAPVELDAVIRGALLALRSQVAEASATVEYAGLPVVSGEGSQLQQLFQNLISNAIKFRGSAAPRVVISAVREGASWLVSVTDNGIGVEMRYAKRIFEMFQRLHERGKYEGSGIGLAIARRIVERHGGRIWVESSGEGSTFRFTLQTMDDES